MASLLAAVWGGFKLRRSATAAAAATAAGGRRRLTASSASMPVSLLLPGFAKVAGVLERKAPQQQAAYAAFVSTAKPIAWTKAKGWAQPVARVGAGKRLDVGQVLVQLR
jgi:hypothetical protein